MDFYDEIHAALMPVVRKLRLPVEPFERGLAELLQEYPRYRITSSCGEDESWPDNNLCKEHARDYFTFHPTHKVIDQWVNTCDDCDRDPPYRVFDFAHFARYATAWGFGIRKTPDEMHEWIEDFESLTYAELKQLAKLC